MAPGSQCWQQSQLAYGSQPANYSAAYNNVPFSLFNGALTNRQNMLTRGVVAAMMTMWRRNVI